MKYYLCSESSDSDGFYSCSSVTFVNGIQVCGSVKFQFDYAGCVFCASCGSSIDLDPDQLTIKF